MEQSEQAGQIEQIEPSETAEALAKQTLSGGLVPVEWDILPLFSCADGALYGGLLRGAVNSPFCGHLTEEQYAPALENHPAGIALCLRLCRKFLAVRQECPAMRERLRFYLHAPLALLFEQDPYACLTEAFGPPPARGQYRSLTFVFSPAAFAADTSTLRAAASAFHAAGFRLAVRGFGAPDFPVGRLFTFAPDALFVDPAFAALLPDPARRAAAQAMLRVADGLSIRLLSAEIPDDETARALASADVAAFAPAPAYRGALPGRTAPMNPADFAAYAGGDNV